MQGKVEICGVNTSKLPVRKAISLWTMEEAKAVTEKAMSLETEEEVQAFLKEHEKK